MQTLCVTEKLRCDKFVSYFMLILVKNVSLISLLSFMALLRRDSYRLQYTCHI